MNVGIPVGNASSLLNRDYTITAEITVPKAGAEGMIATMGGRATEPRCEWAARRAPRTVMLATAARPGADW